MWFRLPLLARIVAGVGNVLTFDTDNSVQAQLRTQAPLPGDTQMSVWCNWQHTCPPSMWYGLGFRYRLLWEISPVGLERSSDKREVTRSNRVFPTKALTQM